MSDSPDSGHSPKAMAAALSDAKSARQQAVGADGARVASVMPRPWVERVGLDLSATAMVAVAAGLVAVALAWFAWDRRQERVHDEEVLAFAGSEIRDAIASYYAVPLGNGRHELPGALSELVDDRRDGQVHHHIERIPVDPMTGRRDWLLVRSAEKLLVGVRSRSHRVPLQVAFYDLRSSPYSGRMHYSDVAFLFDPASLRTAASGQAVRSAESAIPQAPQALSALRTAGLALPVDERTVRTAALPSRSAGPDVGRTVGRSGRAGIVIADHGLLDAPRMVLADGTTLSGADPGPRADVARAIPGALVRGESGGPSAGSGVAPGAIGSDAKLPASVASPASDVGRLFASAVAEDPLRAGSAPSAPGRAMPVASAELPTAAAPPKPEAEPAWLRPAVLGEFRGVPVYMRPAPAMASDAPLKDLQDPPRFEARAVASPAVPGQSQPVPSQATGGAPAQAVALQPATNPVAMPSADVSVVPTRSSMEAASSVGRGEGLIQSRKGKDGIVELSYSGPLGGSEIQAISSIPNNRPQTVAMVDEQTPPAVIACQEAARHESEECQDAASQAGIGRRASNKAALASCLSQASERRNACIALVRGPTSEH